MKYKVNLEDYKRLTKLSPTIEREFVAFKLDVFNKTLLFGVDTQKKSGIKYDIVNFVVHNFDGHATLAYEEAAAIAYNKYYRAISGFILAPEVRIEYLNLAIAAGPSRAIKIMQHCAKVPQDGIIGPVTRERMQYVNIECLQKATQGIRFKYYVLRRRLGNFFSPSN
jgi:hypothetical protein